ncbi:MAG: transposase [Candidatus Gracilibacteria bacterium]|nr:transposase [Candidatus Gracilibacteria bacterium]
MKYNPHIHNRQTIRLRGYDYSQDGAYFVTICVQNRERLFGEVVDGVMGLNDAGRMIQSIWDELGERFHNIRLDECVVMPNHFHGIIFINSNVGAPLVGALMNNADDNRVGTRPTPTNDVMNDGIDSMDGAGTRPAPSVRVPRVGTLGEIVGAFKSITTFEYTNGVKNDNWPPFGGKLWQRNYYEHIIRDETSLEKIRTYIIDNPHNWETDDLNTNP